MIHTLLSIVLIILGIVLAFTLAGALLKIIGYVLIAAGVVWLVTYLFGRRGTAVR